MAYLEYHPGDPSTGQQEALSIVSIDERDENEKRFSLIGIAIDHNLSGKNNVTAEDVNHLMYSGPRNLPPKVIRKILGFIDESPVIVAPHNLSAVDGSIGDSDATIEPFIEPIDEAILDQFSDDVSRHVQDVIAKYEDTEDKYTHAAYQAQIIKTETGHEIVDHRSFGAVEDGVYTPRFTVLSHSYLAEARAQLEEAEEAKREQQITELEALYQL